jgi:DNA-binding transcriptional MerR regulator
VPQHVLRFWETKFSQIKPLKRNGGRRFYRPDDIDTLMKIKFLLYRQGYTIKGAKKVFDDKNSDELIKRLTRESATGGVNDNAPVCADVSESPTVDAKAPKDVSDIIANLKSLSKELKGESLR